MMREPNTAPRMRTGRGLLPLIVVAGSVLAVIASACADFDAPASPDETLPDVLVTTPSLANDIQPILTARCATSSCHTSVTQQAGLSLEAGDSYAETVGVPSTRRLSRLRVDPGDPDNSMMYLTLTEQSPIVRMPLGRAPLTNNQIENIRRWIANGAPNN